MTSIICAMCRDTFETKPALSTTCGHIFCPNCATSTFTTCSTCPVCRRVQTFGQLIRLFPEHSTVSPDASRSTIASPDGVPTPQVVPPMPQPPPYQNPHWQPSASEPSPPYHPIYLVTSNLGRRDRQTLPMDAGRGRTCVRPGRIPGLPRGRHLQKRHAPM